MNSWNEFGPIVNQLVFIGWSKILGYTCYLKGDQMTIFCTNCSAAKDRSSGEIPAIKRYRSQRISSVHAAAMGLGLRFVIFSGEFGILQPEDPIPYYDHLLLPGEVTEHATLVASQLEALDISDLIFFCRPFSVDESARTYYDCLKQAAHMAGTTLKLVHYKGG